MKIKQFLAYVLAVVVLYGCIAEAQAAVKRLRVEFWQDADSARYAISWRAGPQGNRQRPTAFYELEILSDSLVVASDTTSALADTLAIAYPPLDSIMPLLARVRAVDTDGDPSEWAESNPFTLVTPKLPPSPPDSVRADTVVAAAEIILRPSFVSLPLGDMVRFCAIYRLPNGDSGLTINSRLAACDPVYARWLTEVGV